MATKIEERPHFFTQDGKAILHVVGQIVRNDRKKRLDYADFLCVYQQARKKLGLRKPRKERKLPRLLPEADRERVFRVLQSAATCSMRSSSSCFSGRPCASPS